MKSKISKDLVLFIILVPVFLWGAFYISGTLENRLPPYSVINESGTGCSVYFQALKELGYPVERTVRAIGEFSRDDIQVVAQNGSFDIKDKDTKAWIRKGGVLIYLAPAINLLDIEYGAPKIINGYIKVYKYFDGTIISTDVKGITNRELLESASGAYALLEELKNYSYKKLVFNEAHLYALIYQRSLWDALPMEIRYLFYQLLIMLAAVFYLKGKRFGKPLPLYEEVERSENEYLYSAAALYRQANCWDVMLENYYKDFLKQADSTHEGWLEYWEREKLPDADKARRIYEFMHTARGKTRAREYAQMIMTLEQLKAILKKRRDSYWKTLKRTM